MLSSGYNRDTDASENEADLVEKSEEDNIWKVLHTITMSQSGKLPTTPRPLLPWKF